MNDAVMDREKLVSLLVRAYLVFKNEVKGLCEVS